MRKPVFSAGLTGKLSAIGALVCVLGVCASSSHGAIDARKDRTYKLSSKHGPWMIMVTSLSGETIDQERRAEKAANELVYQLRRKGVPAYVYRLEEQYEEVAGVDLMGRGRKRKYLSQHGMIGVVAGNYDSMEDRVAQQTLKFIKKFEPKLSTEGPDGKPQDISLSLSKAFLARNPLLSPEELARRTRDPLLLKLNSGHEYSLLQNKGKHTLIVSSFYGNSVVKPKDFERFEKAQYKGANISLENAALESEQLCRAMRNQGIEAYVWHERFRSVVTVGSFDSPRDPKIAELGQKFQAKYRRVDDKSTKEVLVAESIQIANRQKGAAPVKAWTMDPRPELMDVPGK